MKYTHTERIDPYIMNLGTEQVNEKTRGIASKSVEEMLRLINEEDRTVPDRVAEAIPAIARAVELIVPRMEKGGRMVYVGAGTSARLAFLDAAECPPTYYTAYDAVSCVMAGGRECVFRAKEHLEDSFEDAGRDLKEFGLTGLDTVIAAAASGRTPYGIGALEYAREIGAGRVCIACNRPSALSRYAQVAIDMDTGAEAIAFSTRMKAGTAQKLAMNMLSTCVMIKLGRTYDNLTFESARPNSKGSNRNPRLFAEAIGNPDLDYACKRLEESDGCPRCALMKELLGADDETARYACDHCGGSVMKALEIARKRMSAGRR